MVYTGTSTGIFICCNWEKMKASQKKCLKAGTMFIHFSIFQDNVFAAIFNFFNQMRNTFWNLFERFIQSNYLE